MKKICSLLMLLAIMAVAAPAFASLDDTRETIAQTYGDFRLVIDSDNQLPR